MGVASLTVNLNAVSVCHPQLAETCFQLSSLCLNPQSAMSKATSNGKQLGPLLYNFMLKRTTLLRKSVSSEFCAHIFLDWWHLNL